MPSALSPNLLHFLYLSLTSTSELGFSYFLVVIIIIIVVFDVILTVHRR